MAWKSGLAMLSHGNVMSLLPPSLVKSMVMTLAIPIRAFYGLKDFITEKHLDVMAKVMLATGLIVAYGYAVEAFIAWYSGSPYEAYMITNRLHGPYWRVYWSLLLCNILIPQVLWMKAARRSVFVRPPKGPIVDDDER